jgi:hypothetical protein
MEFFTIAMARLRSAARIRVVCALIAALFLAGGGVTKAQDAKPLTNQDVINLIQAKMSEETVIMAIKSARPGFNTSADALIKLSQAGVSEPVIRAMIEAGKSQAAAPPAPAPRAPAKPAASPPAPKAAAFNPEEMILIQGSERSSMHYLTPQIRTAVRALGFGGVGQYAVLRGAQAQLRLRNSQPSFLMAVPNNAQVEGYFTLARMAVRNNGTREILTGGGYMGYSTGVHPDRIVPTASEKAADQSSAPAGFTIYRVTPQQPLSQSEYAMILYNSQVRVVGFFMSGMDSYFDFGVDG